MSLVQVEVRAAALEEVVPEVPAAMMEGMDRTRPNDQAQAAANPLVVRGERMPNRGRHLRN